MEGKGKVLITAVGVNSQTGIIMTLLGAAKSDGAEAAANQQRNATNAAGNQQSTFLLFI